MKKATITISFEEEKRNAARLYMEQRGLTFEGELTKAADSLYDKYVPANVRDFLERSAGVPSAPPRAKKPKPAPQGGDVV